MQLEGMRLLPECFFYFIFTLVPNMFLGFIFGALCTFWASKNGNFETISSYFTIIYIHTHHMFVCLTFDDRLLLIFARAFCCLNFAIWSTSF